MKKRPRSDGFTELRFSLFEVDMSGHRKEISSEVYPLLSAPVPNLAVFCDIIYRPLPRIINYF